ncbi:MAG: TIGR04282 family arsenosugar biosynthesis glycosyltransferase [Armatimonadetes bacterium]|nr:TIGR04282 family arsenosugar biosynthesis glycosyltransferase [Armatimonadota bacterium]
MRRESSLTPESNTLYIVAKAPVAGRVKTRLVGNAWNEGGVAALAGAFLTDTFSLATHPLVPARVVLALGGNPTDLPLPLLSLPHVPQGDGDLGERLTRLFAASFAGGAASVCAIGSDTPHLPPAFLVEAFGRLASPDVDIVLGRADDGGYYLLGMNKPCPEVFERIDWGTAAVWAQTLARAATANRRAALLPPWYDIDTPADLERLRRDLGRGVVTAPGTVAVFPL